MTVYEQTAAAAAEICERAHLQPGSILVVGCSTSEVVGSKIGTNSSVETAGEIARALLDVTGSRGVFLAVQCCEHLNRAIITERAAVPGAEIVNVVPQPKAGGSLATQVYAALKEPVALRGDQGGRRARYRFHAHRHAPQKGRGAGAARKPHDRRGDGRRGTHAPQIHRRRESRVRRDHAVIETIIKRQRQTMKNVCLCCISENHALDARFKRAFGDEGDKKTPFALE